MSDPRLFQRFDVFCAHRIVACAVLLTFVFGAVPQAAHPADKSRPDKSPGRITIDGMFQDWAGVKRYTDPPNDQTDTDGKTKDYKPIPRQNPDVDILAYKFTHDNENLYAYVRVSGQVGRTQKGTKGPQGKQEKKAGRYYITLAIDVDQNDETGYWLHQGGTYPTSGGYDVNAEIEWYDGEFNTGMYMNKCCTDDADLKQAFLDQSQGKYVKGNDGPYPAGFMRIKKGIYDFYTQWVYHKDGTITFVRDRGPVVHGILRGARSDDGRELEMRIPMKGFLVDANGDAVVALGRTIDISFSLIASGELAPDKEWAADAAEPIQRYHLKPLP